MMMEKSFFVHIKHGTLFVMKVEKYSGFFNPFRDGKDETRASLQQPLNWEWGNDGNIYCAAGSCSVSACYILFDGLRNRGNNKWIRMSKQLLLKMKSSSNNTNLSTRVSFIIIFEGVHLLPKDLLHVICLSPCYAECNFYDLTLFYIAKFIMKPGIWKIARFFQILCLPTCVNKNTISKLKWVLRDPGIRKTRILTNNGKEGFTENNMILLLFRHQHHSHQHKTDSFIV